MRSQSSCASRCRHTCCCFMVTPPCLAHCTQLPQCKHLFSIYKTCGSFFKPSGFWHQTQRKGHPFKNSVVRMPFPSCVAKRLISNTLPRHSDVVIACSRNDFILQLTCQFGKICRIASHTHGQRTILFRMFLRGQ